MNYKRFQYQYHLLLLPAMIFLVIFHFIPLSGIAIAFTKFVPAKGIFGSKWVGLANFEYMFKLPDSYRIFRNTLTIAIFKIVLGILVPVCFSLLLNELRSIKYRRVIQTVTYVPHFLSWVVLAASIKNIFAYNGMVNDLVVLLGGERTALMVNNSYFRSILIWSDVWKEFGFGTIVYLSAITGIDNSLYEAAEMDGAGRFQKIIHVTLPGMTSIIVLMVVRSLSGVLNAGFDQVFNLYSPPVYETADIIDTYVYRVGLLDRNYSLSTAIGTLKSVVAMILILTSNKLAAKLANYQIF